MVFLYIFLLFKQPKERLRSKRTIKEERKKCCGFINNVKFFLFNFTNLFKKNRHPNEIIQKYDSPEHVRNLKLEDLKEGKFF